jgi:DNA polymerase I-like protein with 3'-5' exonuclease and polymerase domains
MTATTHDVSPIDFETTYRKKVRDIATLGVVPYLEHPETDIYLVSTRLPGEEFSGHPTEAPWERLNGRHWVSHNAGFDAAVFMELRRVAGGALDDVLPHEWDCTANLCAFLAAPRSLAGAVEQLYGVVLSKEVRDQMNGKTWDTMSPEFRQQAIAYAMEDSRWCERIWRDHSHRWPRQELELSRHTMSMCLNGLAIDVPKVEADIATLRKAIWHCEQAIPWHGELDARGKEIKIGSRTALFAACDKEQIPRPTSTADKSEAYNEWLEEYGYMAPFVGALKDHRSLERTLKVLVKIRDQVRANGRLSYSLLYFGGHTGRWSGSGGLNFHNLTKEPLLFDASGKKLPKGTKKDSPLVVSVVDLRGCIIPEPGKKFIIADLKQIEARVSLWYAEDWAQLDLLRDGMDVYEAHARRTMGYTRPEKLADYVASPNCPEKDRNLRQIAKARVLGLGFGMGWKRLLEFAKVQLGLVLTPTEAKSIVDYFRRANPGIVRMWERLDMAIRSHASRQSKAGANGPFTIELPSWRSLSYFDVNSSDEGIRARDEMGGVVHHWFGGKLFENLVQATARDVLAEAILRIEAAGHRIVLHVHDEVIIECDPSVTDAEIHRLMTQTPEWAPGLPVDSSVDSTDRYCS